MSAHKPFVPAGTLEGKVILITGASQGVGLIAARGFAQAGAKVVLGARRGALVEKAAQEIEGAGGEAIGVPLDVTDEASVAAAVDVTERQYGRLDGLFNVAAIDQAAHDLFADYPLDDWKRVHAVKIDGTFLCSKYAIRTMRKAGNGGSIVNCGSGISELTMAQYAAASSSQAAILGLTRSAAIGHGPDNIRVNALLIGLIVTPERAETTYKGMDELMHSVSSLRRAGKAEEVAQVAAWLLSDYASYVNGAMIPVDGGYLAGRNNG